MWDIKQRAIGKVVEATNSAKWGLKNLGLWGSNMIRAVIQILVSPSLEPERALSIIQDILQGNSLPLLLLLVYQNSKMLSFSTKGYNVPSQRN